MKILVNGQSMHSPAYPLSRGSSQAMQDVRAVPDRDARTRLLTACSATCLIVATAIYGLQTAPF